MATTTKIKSISLTRLINPEFVTFMGRFRKLIPEKSDETPEENPSNVLTGPAALGILDEQLAAFDADYALLEDLVKEIRSKEESQLMYDVDHGRDRQLSVIIQAMSAFLESAVPAKKAAAQALYRFGKNYSSAYKSPNPIETAEIDGFITDLEKPGMPELVEVLGLTPEVKALKDLNNQFKELTQQRVESKQNTAKEKSADIRKRMGELYVEMITMADARNIVQPSEITTNFIVQLNIIIDETVNSHMMRKTNTKNDSPKDPKDPTQPTNPTQPTDPANPNETEQPKV